MKERTKAKLAAIDDGHDWVDGQTYSHGGTSYSPNLETIIRAAKAGHLALLEVREKATGAIRTAIVAVGFDGVEYRMTPFALMIDGNPFELLDPPNPDGGWFEGP